MITSSIPSFQARKQNRNLEPGFHTLLSLSALALKKKENENENEEQKRKSMNACALMLFLFVVMDGIEPPTQGFSVLCSTN